MTPACFVPTVLSRACDDRFPCGALNRSSICVCGSCAPSRSSLCSPPPVRAKTNPRFEKFVDPGEIEFFSKKSPLFSWFIKDGSVPRKTRMNAIHELYSEAGFLNVTKNFFDGGRIPS